MEHKLIMENWRRYKKIMNEEAFEMVYGEEPSMLNDKELETLNRAVQRDSYLVFQGDELKWISKGKTIKSWRATSGQLDLLPGVDYIQALKRLVQGKSNFGPIPEGIYSIPNAWQTSLKTEDPGMLDRTKYMWLSIKAKFMGDKDAKSTLKNTTRFFDKKSVMSNIAWGDFRVRIKKTKNSILANKYARGSFFLHGGALEGSSGCVDLGDGLENFVKFWSLQSYATQRGMRLLVDYDDKILQKISDKDPSLAKQSWFQDMVKYGDLGNS
jgi:hypothetical protein